MKFIMSICLILSSFSAQAAINKWVDAEGNIHYSDSRPGDVKTSIIKSQLTSPETISTASGVVAPKTMAEKELDWKKSQQEKEKAEKNAAKQKEEASIKQKNCENARGYLATVENSPALVTYNAEGERTVMDDATRSAKIEEARKSVANYCN